MSTHPRPIAPNDPPPFPPGTQFVKARAYQTDETFGYDRWVADQYSCGRGIRDAYIVLLPDQPTAPTVAPSKMDALTEAIDKAGVYDNATPSSDGAAPSGTPRTSALRARVPLVALWAHECLDLADNLEHELAAANTVIAQMRDELAARDAEIARWKCEAEVASIGRDTLRAEVERLQDVAVNGAGAACLTELRAKCDRLRGLLAIPDTQGVSFGDCWLSYDKMLGYEGPDGAERDAFYSGRIIARGLMKWAASIRAELAAIGITRPKETKL